ncbi:MAG: hypothetical protein ACMUIE_09655, partial [Thermoplasmatota archaeon]
ICSPGGIADRLIMGYVGGTSEFLPSALSFSRPEGCIIHFHDTLPVEKGLNGAFEDLSKRAGALGWISRLISSRRIKSYAPRIDHIVMDVLVRPAQDFGN